MQPVNVMSADKSPVRIVGFDDIEFAPRFEYGEMAEVAGVCGFDDGSELVVEQLRIDGYRASQIGQSKAQSAGNGMSFSRTATRHWPIWGAPFGPARKQPSALLCSLELATASPAVARLAADCFLTGCIHQSLVVRPRGVGWGRLRNARIPWTIRYDEVLTVFEGELRVHTGSEVHELQPRDCIWLPAGTELVYEAELALVHFAIHPSDWHEGS